MAHPQKLDVRHCQTVRLSFVTWKDEEILLKVLQNLHITVYVIYVSV